MEIAAPPVLNLKVLSQTQFRELFAAYVTSFNHLGLDQPSNEAYITLTADDAPVGVVRVASFQSNEYLSFLEVRGDKGGHGYGKKLLRAAFEFSAQHTGELLLSSYTPQGQRLDREVDRLKGMIPGVTAHHLQTC